MQQLIDQITSEYDMSNEDATRIIEIVQNYQPLNAAEANAENTVKADDVNDEVEENTVTEKAAQPTAAAAPLAAAEAPAEEENMFQKATHFVEDHLPSGMKEKADEMLGGLGDKVKGFFK
jgi:hypothetical protein